MVSDKQVERLLGIADDIETTDFNAADPRYLAEEIRRIAASLSPPVEGTAWNDRSVPTPKGTLIWVSDGEDIWLLEGDGNIFPDRATACRWWSQASFPTLPSGAVASNIDGFCIPSGPVGGES